MNQLWYSQPATYWDEALPVGNGRVGGMVYGGVHKEKIQLNEESLWSGKSIDRINPDCLSNLSQIRKLVFDGKINEAEQLAVYAMSGIPQSQRNYQTLGELLITHDFAKSEYKNYRRQLDLNDATVMSTWEMGDTTYTQELFTSNPADCMVIHLQAEGSGKLNFDCRLERKRHMDRAYAVDPHTISYDGDANGIQFCGILMVSSCDGKVQTLGEHLIIEEAMEVTLLFSAATSFREPNPYQKVLEILKKQVQYKYEFLKEEHRKDYQNLFNSVELKFYTEEKESIKLPIDERLERFAETGEDAELISLYFQYGRYLLIACSRKGGLPANLQGIWNNEFMPPWDSKYTININTQMNYWPADICNLSDCTEPYFSLLKRVMDSGKITAEKMYGCHGFVAHHNTDIYADTAPQDLYIPATYWVMGGAWLTLHIWEHYQFTKDIEFLKDNFEVIREAVLFFKDFLVEDKDGQLVTCPSVSPENTYIMQDGTSGCMCMGPTMDNEILFQLFSDFIMACNELGEADELIEEVQIMLEKLPKLQIGKQGQLLEWMEEYDELEPGHRHISHLFGVFPGSQITLEDTPELAKAAKTSLDLRLMNGGGHTGWSRAWIILLWDRFKDGEKAYENLKELISHSTFINLMDNHPFICPREKVFQIDGNFGGITGIAEMLIQSHNGRIELLPALPEELSGGYVRGLRVRGNATVEMEWKNGILVYFKIIPESNMEVMLCYQSKKKPIILQKNIEYQFDFELKEME